MSVGAGWVMSGSGGWVIGLVLLGEASVPDVTAAGMR
jgi:hypothetical protein